MLKLDVRKKVGLEIDSMALVCTKRAATYSKKFVMSLLEHFDQATPTVSASNVGVMTCSLSPSLLLHPIFSVS